jgi:nucleotide-binding universal stress UspA family protein
MKILIATDGSTFGQKAIEFCRNIIAKPDETSVKIISVVEPMAPMAAEPFAISGEYYAQVENYSHQTAVNFTESAEMSLKKMFPDSALDTSTAVLTGSPARMIVEAAREWGADLIVVGSHGYGFWSRALLGSVSSSVVHHAPCSVLIVRAEKE